MLVSGDVRLGMRLQNPSFLANKWGWQQPYSRGRGHSDAFERNTGALEEDCICQNICTVYFSGYVSWKETTLGKAEKPERKITGQELVPVKK